MGACSVQDDFNAVCMNMSTVTPKSRHYLMNPAEKPEILLSGCSRCLPYEQGLSLMNAAR